MFQSFGSRKVVALAIGCLTLAACGSSGTPGVSGSGTPVTNKPITTAPATFVGPLLTSDETATVTLGRDGGFSVPLPNGKTFWVFGDTPTYTYQDGSWKLTAFIQGSSAGLVAYTPGQRPTSPIDEVAVGQPTTSATPATQFLAPPEVYLPDGSGKICNKENGGPTAGAVRWATGAALLSDKTNVFVPYIDACVISATVHQAEGWGFALYNWKTNKFTVPPTDVIVPEKSGKAISMAQYFGSPIVKGEKISMFSATCCEVGSSVYVTTVDADVETLKDYASYRPTPIAGVPATFTLSVSPPSPTQPQLTMYQLSSLQGGYRIFTASSPTGPWVERAQGTLPQCAGAPAPCNNSIYLHPELSSKSELLVSYWLPGYGPGIDTNPDPSDQIWHLVYANLPI
jgi:hypothetical protein